MRKGVLRARGYRFLSPPHGAKASRGHGVLTAHACAARHTCKQNERGEERRSPVFQGQRGQALGLLSDPLTRTRIIERRKKVAPRRRVGTPTLHSFPAVPSRPPHPPLGAACASASHCSQTPQLSARAKSDNRRTANGRGSKFTSVLAAVRRP